MFVHVFLHFDGSSMCFFSVLAGREMTPEKFRQINERKVAINGRKQGIKQGGKQQKHRPPARQQGKVESAQQVSLHLDLRGGFLFWRGIF